MAEPESEVTALCVAAEHQQEQMVRQLLALRADVNRASSSGNTALHFAARSGSPAILALLQEAGASCAVCAREARLRHGCVHPWIPDPSDERGARLQTQNRNGDTPLLQAVAAGKLESVSWLVSVAGASGGKTSGASGRRTESSSMFAVAVNVASGF